MPLVEGARTVPGGLPARLAHLQGPRSLADASGAGEALEVEHGCWRQIPPASTDVSARVRKINDNVADDADDADDGDDATTSFGVAPGTPPTTLRANAHVLRAPGGSLLMGPWHGAFARADETGKGSLSPAMGDEGAVKRDASPRRRSAEDGDVSARRATVLRDLGVDTAHAEHIAELAFCGADEMRLDEGQAVSLELVSEDAVAGGFSRRRETNADGFPRRRDGARSAPAAPTRKVDAQRVATRRRPSASFVRARREDARSKEGETRRGHGDVSVGKGFGAAPQTRKSRGAQSAAGARLMRPRASGSRGA